MKHLAWLPALLFAFWVERNCSLPWIPQELGWPWIFVDGETVDHMIWNSGFVILLSALGVGLFRSHRPARTPLWSRACVWGLFCILLMSLWQPTGVVLFQLIPHATLSAFVSFFIFWGILSAAFRFSDQPARIKKFLLAAVFFTPFLTADRLMVGMGLGLFTLLTRTSDPVKQREHIH